MLQKYFLCFSVFIASVSQHGTLDIEADVPKILGSLTIEEEFTTTLKPKTTEEPDEKNQACC